MKHIYLVLQNTLALSAINNNSSAAAKENLIHPLETTKYSFVSPPEAMANRLETVDSQDAVSIHAQFEALKLENTELTLVGSDLEKENARRIPEEKNIQNKLSTY